jgi:hypothetical protein
MPRHPLCLVQAKIAAQPDVSAHCSSCSVQSLHRQRSQESDAQARQFCSKLLDSFPAPHVAGAEPPVPPTLTALPAAPAVEPVPAAAFPPLLAPAVPPSLLAAPATVTAPASAPPPAPPPCGDDESASLSREDPQAQKKTPRPKVRSNTEGVPSCRDREPAGGCEPHRCLHRSSGGSLRVGVGESLPRRFFRNDAGSAAERERRSPRTLKDGAAAPPPHSQNLTCRNQVSLSRVPSPKIRVAKQHHKPCSSSGRRRSCRSRYHFP